MLDAEDKVDWYTTQFDRSQGDLSRAADGLAWAEMGLQRVKERIALESSTNMAGEPLNEAGAWGGEGQLSQK